MGRAHTKVCFVLELSSISLGHPHLSCASICLSSPQSHVPTLNCGSSFNSPSPMFSTMWQVQNNELLCNHVWKIWEDGAEGSTHVSLLSILIDWVGVLFHPVEVVNCFFSVLFILCFFFFSSWPPMYRCLLWVSECSLGCCLGLQAINIQCQLGACVLWRHTSLCISKTGELWTSPCRKEVLSPQTILYMQQLNPSLHRDGNGARPWSLCCKVNLHPHLPPPCI